MLYPSEAIHFSEPSDEAKATFAAIRVAWRVDQLSKGPGRTEWSRRDFKKAAEQLAHDQIALLYLISDSPRLATLRRANPYPVRFDGRCHESFAEAACAIGESCLMWFSVAHQGEYKSPGFAGEDGQGQRDIINGDGAIEAWEHIRDELPRFDYIELAIQLKKEFGRAYSGSTEEISVSTPAAYAGYLTAAQVADKVQQSRDAVEKKLQRFRENNPKSRAFLEVASARKNDPRYVYCESLIVPFLQDYGAADERPSKK